MREDELRSEEEERDIEGEVAVLTIDGEKMQYAGVQVVRNLRSTTSAVTRGRKSEETPELGDWL